MSELELIVDSARLPAEPITLEADADQRAALARRFGLVAVDSLKARVTLTHADGGIAAKGTLEAAVVQSCAISGEDLPVKLAEPIALRFVPPARHDAEVELQESDLDEIEMENGRFDLGEAVAQTLALAIDPYLEGPNADAFRRKAGLLGEAEAGPLAAALKDLLKK